MKKSSVLIALCFMSFFGAIAQQKKELKNPKVIVITLDGFRWQELFTGADNKLIANKKYVEDTIGLKEKFWRKTAEERRVALMPFFWNEVSKMGELHGNRNQGSNVNLTNSMWFSYPGYNEILTGSADDIRINSNDKINNPNTTILEKINKLPKYKGKVAAFGSWDVFPFIINEERSGIPVNAGFEAAKEGELSPREMFLNEMQTKVPSPWDSVRFDAFTSNYALEYMKKEHPELVYISLGETDDFAHDGNYQAYLKSANASDGLIQELWNFTQKDSFYKDNTIFIVSTDHGRGTDPLDEWKSHGSKIAGADQVWLVIFGNGIQPKGEVISSEQIFSNQIAPTVLHLFDPKAKDPEMKGPPLQILEK
ncbi:sulfatase-like hydrolase/transferase [Flavobacterium geliluteum]|uniref:Alkaline phosphatase family protein n=1 Tax=Flavobacterium geliluteum TaxID=2816120 RepID=A0A941AXS4_9FLAO|nr:alkaline phosphatase family protein [Flavobacterium geliluteum]MBP4136917.1 alkaline phosphatase family protein [Flavobacterium geliluteum]